MEYQLRHVRFGLFQGRLCGGFAWLPLSGFPEFGIQRFEKEADAVSVMLALCQTNPLVFRPEDFMIEPFDLEGHCRVVTYGLHRLRLRRLWKYHFASIEENRRHA